MVGWRGREKKVEVRRFISQRVFFCSSLAGLRPCSSCWRCRKWNAWLTGRFVLLGWIWLASCSRQLLSFTPVNVQNDLLWAIVRTVLVKISLGSLLGMRPSSSTSSELLRVECPLGEQIIVFVIFQLCPIWYSMLGISIIAIPFFPFTRLSSGYQSQTNLGSVFHTRFPL